MNSDPIKTTFVTFYSFKGGVGRSMALINTASILAGTRGFRVLVLDLDLEAPGLSYLNSKTPEVDPADTQRNLPLQPGFVDLLTDAKERGEGADLFQLTDEALRDKYTRKINLPEDLCKFPGGSLHIMPAGRFDDEYSRRLDALNLNSLYREGLGEPLIRAFKKKLSASGLYHYVLVDSRTGISEGAGICTRDLADHVMVLSGLNRQNVEGTSEFLREFRKATNAEKKIQIILSPIPNGEDALVDVRREVAAKRFKEAWGDDIELTLEIPYHPQLALTEEPHIFRRSRGYLFEAYRRIEESLLKELGHVAQNFRRQILEALKRKQYSEALRDLSIMIRLDDGYRMLSRLVDVLLSENAISKRGERSISQESVSLEILLEDKGGREVADFIIQEIPISEWAWSTRQLIRKLNRKFPEWAEKLHQRILEQGNGEYLGRYAVTLEHLNQSNKAEVAYNRALKADPKNADILGNYAALLLKQERTAEAEPFLQRALEADPKDAVILGNYAICLGNQGRTADAETFCLRALEAAPKNADILGNYAALLLKQERTAEAEPFLQRALEADPKDAAILGNYGQFLMGEARTHEGEAFLLKSSHHFDGVGYDNIAEICFALWLCLRMQGRDAGEWEGCFKFALQNGFKRYPWSFARMLKHAEKLLSPEEFEYANALAAAFLDESKVAALDKFPRWHSVKPIDPKQLSSGANPAQPSSSAS